MSELLRFRRGEGTLVELPTRGELGLQAETSHSAVPHSGDAADSLRLGSTSPTQPCEQPGTDCGLDLFVLSDGQAKGGAPADRAARAASEEENARPFVERFDRILDQAHKVGYLEALADVAALEKLGWGLGRHTIVMLTAAYDAKRRGRRR
jgi:hypothetical protein